MSWGNEFGKLRRSLNVNIYELYVKNIYIKYLHKYCKINELK